MLKLSIAILSTGKWSPSDEMMHFMTVSSPSIMGAWSHIAEVLMAILIMTKWQVMRLHLFTSPLVQRSWRDVIEKVVWRLANVLIEMMGEVVAAEVMIEEVLSLWEKASSSSLPGSSEMSKARVCMEIGGGE